MKKGRLKCSYCDGTGKREKILRGRGFFACSTEKVMEDCEYCKGSGLGREESHLAAFSRHAVELLALRGPIPDLQERFLASDLKGGSLATLGYSDYPNLGYTKYTLIEMDGFVIIFKEEKAEGLFLAKSGGEFFNIEKNDKLIGKVRIQDLYTQPAKGEDPELIDWDKALQAVDDIYLTLKHISPDSPPKNRKFVPYKPGKVYLKDGMIHSIPKSMSFTVDSVTALIYHEGSGDLEVLLNGGRVELNYDQGAPEARDILVLELARRNNVY